MYVGKRISMLSNLHKSMSVWRRWRCWLKTIKSGPISFPTRDKFIQTSQITKQWPCSHTLNDDGLLPKTILVMRLGPIVLKKRHPFVQPQWTSVWMLGKNASETIQNANGIVLEVARLCWQFQFPFSQVILHELTWTDKMTRRCS